MKLTEKRRQILKQLAVEGSVEQKKLECQNATKLVIRNNFLLHKLIHVEDIEASGRGPGGRHRKIWVVEINGVILALKNNLVKPSEMVKVSHVVKDRLVSWLEQGLKLVKNRGAKKSFRKILYAFSRFIEENPELCHLLTSFDFEFCPPYFALASLFHISYGLRMLEEPSKRRLKQIKKEIKNAEKAIPDLMHATLRYIEKQG